MNITYEISEDRNTLTLRASPEAQAELREVRTDDPGWGTTKMEAEVLEHLLCNSELSWVFPSDTGDLTDAPLLGIYGSEEEKTSEPKGPFGAMWVGGDGKNDWFCPILERWGYEPYQIRSFLDDLADKGEAEFVNHW